MSDFSLAFVLQFKTSENINRMANIIIKSQKSPPLVEFSYKVCLQICSINVLAKFGVVEKENPCKLRTCRDFPWRVPGGTRTLDIQNHNLTL